MPKTKSDFKMPTLENKTIGGGVRVCGIAVIFVSKYGIAVFRVQAVCGKFKSYVAVGGEKNRCVAVICFFFMTRGYKS